MAKEEKMDCCSDKKFNPGNGMFGFFYFLTVIGSAVYFIQQTNGFWPGVLGVLKAFIWPAFLIHKVLGLLGL